MKKLILLFVFITGILSAQTTPDLTQVLDVNNKTTDSIVIGASSSLNLYNAQVTGTLGATTSITSPLVVGGNTTTSTLTLQTTSGAGTTNADMLFKVGNGGGTEAMRILNSGLIGINNTAPGEYLSIKCASNTSAFSILNSSVSGTKGWLFYPFTNGTNSDLRIYEYGGNTNRFLLSAGGSIGIGVTSIETAAALQLKKSITGSTGVNVCYSNGTVATDVTSAVGMFVTKPATAAAFTLPSLYHYYVDQGTFSGTVTSQYGFYAHSSMTGATNNYGFYGNIASGSNRYNLYMAGTADNYVAGKFGLNVTSPGANLDIAQSVTSTGTVKGIIYTGAINTNQTASTEISGINFTTAGRQWATGSITLQREVLITAPTYSFVGASTITDAVTLGVTAPVAGTNATITRGWAAQFTGNIAVSAKQYIGALTTAPTALLHLAAGTASANTGALKFTAESGSLAEAGLMGYDGTNFYLSPSTTRKRIPLTDNSTPSNGQIPIGNGTDYTVASITAGTGITVTNGSGSITIATASTILEATLTLTSGQIKALNSTPLTIVSAPGVGKYIQVVCVSGEYTAVSAAYTTNTLLQITASGATLVQAQNANLLLSTVSRNFVFDLVTGSATGSTTATQLLDNTALVVNVATGNPAVGDGTMKLKVFYRVVTI